MGRKGVVSIDSNPNRNRPIFLDLVVGIDGPDFVDGGKDVPSSGVALGNYNGIARSKVVLGPVRIAEHTVAVENVKYFRVGLWIGRGPAALGTEPGSGRESAIVAEFSGAVLGRSPVLGSSGSLGGELVEAEIIEGGVEDVFGPSCFRGYLCCWCCWRRWRNRICRGRPRPVAPIVAFCIVGSRSSRTIVAGDIVQVRKGEGTSSSRR
mmetsp:Transcript_18334/g.39933  ORF Transcript_18334/g.39933 Transcript_18334/m.39933 type:complete len:208 (-) Transcript_18334:274-897(-)